MLDYTGLICLWEFLNSMRRLWITSLALFKMGIARVHEISTWIDKQIRKTPEESSRFLPDPNPTFKRVESDRVEGLAAGRALVRTLRPLLMLWLILLLRKNIICYELS